MRIAVVTGGRDYEPTARDLQDLHRVLTEGDIHVVRCGEATGVDTAIYNHVRDTFARELWAADWTRFAVPGRKNPAGALRNVAMCTGDTSKIDRIASITPTEGKRARLCVAFKGGVGTWNCIRAAKSNGIDVYEIGQGFWR